MLEVTDDQLNRLKAIERLSRRASTCIRIFIRRRHCSRTDIKTTTAVAKLNRHYRHIHNEFIECFAKQETSYVISPDDDIRFLAMGGQEAGFELASLRGEDKDVIDMT